MTCKQVSLWLMRAEVPSEAPPEIAKHLRRCEACIRCQRRLLSLNREVRQMPRPVESPRARRSLFDKLDRLPPPVVCPPPPQRRPNGVVYRRLLAISSVAAALLFLSLMLEGFLSKRPTETEKNVVVQLAPKEPAPAKGGEALAGRLLERDLRLAETAAAPSQLQTFLGMAADLRADAVRLLTEGGKDELQWVASLYEQVVRQGVVGRAKALSDQEKKDLLPRLSRQLLEDAAESEQIADKGATPEAARLRAMAQAARQVNIYLTDGTLPAPPSPVDAAGKSDTMYNLAGALVHNGLRLGGEEDPLRRADYCADIADALVQTILDASAAGDTERPIRLGKHLGAVMDRGVGDNLDRVAATDPEGHRSAEMQRVARRVASATEVLEKNLERVPPPAKQACSALWKPPATARSAPKKPARAKARARGRRSSLRGI